MKKLLIASFFLLTLCLVCSSAFALIVTDNVDKDKFQYQTPYIFATSDLAASLTAAEVPIGQQSSSQVLYYTIPRDSRLVGIAVAGNNNCTAGAATFDVTINGTVTGVQTVIEIAPTRTALGASGSSGKQFAYMLQDRAETNAAQGFRASSNRDDFYDSDNIYGRATPLTAGNYIGVKVTTSSGWSATTTDYSVVVYVLD